MWLLIASHVLTNFQSWRLSISGAFDLYGFHDTTSYNGGSRWYRLTGHYGIVCPAAVTMIVAFGMEHVYICLYTSIIIDLVKTLSLWNFLECLESLRS